MQFKKYNLILTGSKSISKNSENNSSIYFNDNCCYCNFQYFICIIKNLGK